MAKHAADGIEAGSPVGARGAAHPRAESDGLAGSRPEAHVVAASRTGLRTATRVLGRLAGTVVLLALGVVAPPAFADGATQISDATGLTNAFRNGGEYVLTAGLTMEQSLSLDSGKQLSLDLGGHVLGVTGGNGATGGDGNGQDGVAGLANNGTLTVFDGTLAVTGGAGGKGNPGLTTGANGGNGGNGATGLDNTGVLVLAPTVTVTFKGGSGGAGGNGASGGESTTGGNGGNGGNSGPAVSNSGTAVQASASYVVQQGATGSGGLGGAAGSGPAAGSPGAGGTSGGSGNLGASVAFNANGGAAPATIQVFGPAVGTSVAALAQLPTAWPVNGSDTFDGWYTAADGSAAADTSATASGQTLYAHWTDGSGGGTPPVDTCNASTFTSAFTNATSGTVTLCGNLDVTNTNAASLTVATGASITLNLNGHTLTVTAASNQPGIGVPAGTSLTITDSSDDHTGTLTATGGFDGAGIGGGYGAAGGNVTVLDGTVTATGGDYAAGIGGGESASGTSGGTVTISGGTVTATGGPHGGAGIGGSDGSSGTGGTVTISGGAVTATGGSYGGAGIGGGQFAAGGAVTVSGGTVTATGGAGGGAGIGGGADGAGGSLTIETGGSVTALGGNDDDIASAVGSGLGSNTFGTVSNAGTLTIPNGGRVTLPSGSTLTNTGTLVNNGLFTNAGTITGTGTIEGTGSIANGGSIWHTVTVDAGQEVSGNNFQLEFNAEASDGGTTPGSFVIYGPTLSSVGLDWTLFDKPLLGGVPLTGWSFQTDGSVPLLTNDTTVSTVTSTDGTPAAVPLYASWPTPTCTANAFVTAFNSAASSTPVALCGNLTMTAAGLAVAAGQSITLDLNGYTLSVTGAHNQPGIGVPAGTSLTITDSSAAQTGTLTATGGDNSPGIGGAEGGLAGAVTIAAGAHVTVAGDGAAGVSAIGGNWGFPSLTNAGTLTIPAGSIVNIAQNATVTNTGTIVNNGTLGYYGGIAGAGAITNNGTIQSTVHVDTAQTVTGHYYVLHFNPQAAIGAPSDMTVYATTLGAALLTMPTSGFARAGYHLDGWNTAADGSGATVDGDTTFSGAATGGTPITVTAYAQWTQAFSITTTSLPDGTVGAPYSAALATTGGTAPLRWGLAGGGHLPDGLTLDPTTGVLSGTPTVAGTSYLTIGVYDAAENQSMADLALTINPAEDQTNGDTDGGNNGAGNTSGNQGGNSSNPTGDGTPNEPAGQPDGPQTGTSTAPATPQVLGEHQQITPLTIVTITLPVGTIGAPYHLQLRAAGGAGGGYLWTLQSGSLPTGMTLSPSGLITGTPNAAGTFTFVGAVTQADDHTTNRTVLLGTALPSDTGPDRLTTAANHHATARFTLTIKPATAIRVAAADNTAPALASTGVPQSMVPFGIGGVVILLLGAALQRAGRRHDHAARVAPARGRQR